MKLLLALENSEGLREAVAKRQIINLIYEGENIRALLVMTSIALNLNLSIFRLYLGVKRGFTRI